jgi:hypothetical protein
VPPPLPAVVLVLPAAAVVPAWGMPLLPACAFAVPPMLMVEPVLKPLLPPSSPDEQANKAANATHARLTLKAYISKLPRQDAMKWFGLNQIFYGAVQKGASN